MDITTAVWALYKLVLGWDHSEVDGEGTRVHRRFKARNRVGGQCSAFRYHCGEVAAAKRQREQGNKNKKLEKTIAEKARKERQVNECVER